jgi:cytoskeletal protein CcmA (bactofilin family)
MWKKSDNEPLQPTVTAPVAPPVAAPAPARNGPVAPGHEKAIIGPSITIKGELIGAEDLLIQGRVEGRIDLRKHNITVGKSGRVKADLFGLSITVEGEVEGNLFGAEQVVVRQSGVVQGNITAPRVSLEDGSKFKGSIDMEPKHAEPPRVQAVAAGSLQTEMPAAETVVKANGPVKAETGVGKK